MPKYFLSIPACFSFSPYLIKSIEFLPYPSTFEPKLLFFWFLDFKGVRSLALGKKLGLDAFGPAALDLNLPALLIQPDDRSANGILAADYLGIFTA